MTVQEKMEAYRKRHGYSVRDMSWRSGASEVLLRMLEHGHVTHPKIARQVGRAYNLSTDDINELIPPNYRPGENYDPDKYVQHVPDSKYAVVGRIPKEEADYYAYITENGRAIKKNGRRGVIK